MLLPRFAWVFLFFFFVFPLAAIPAKFLDFCAERRTGWIFLLLPLFAPTRSILFPRLGAEVNSRLAFSAVGEGGALGIQVGGGWVRPISVRFGMGRDLITDRRRRLRIGGGNRCELYQCFLCDVCCDWQLGKEGIRAKLE